jgi:hypothetical protein
LPQYFWVIEVTIVLRLLTWLYTQQAGRQAGSLSLFPSPSFLLLSGPALYSFLSNALPPLD